MNTATLIAQLKKNSISIGLVNADLEVRAPKNALTGDLIALIKEHKAQLVEWLSNASSTGYTVIPAQTGDRPYYPLSNAQKRLWVVDQLEADKEKTAYNNFEAIVIGGTLVADALRRAFEAVVDRHESLRTVFVNLDGEPFQQICPRQQLGYSLQLIDLSATPNAEKVARELAATEAGKKFNLACGPLIRTQLIRLSENSHLFFLTLHHIISDGWSVEVLVREILALYNGYVNNVAVLLPPLSIQYKDYAVWQNQLLQDGSMHQHRLYWLHQLAGELPVLELPTDFRRPEIKTNNGATATILIDGPLRTSIDTRSRTSGASVFTLLLTAVKILLHRYSGQEDIIVGIPVAGRDHPDLEDQIGFYINTLALRTQVKPGDSVNDLLLQIKETSASAYEHQAYPFDQLVEDLQLTRDMSRMPVYDVVVVMQNTDVIQQKELPPLAGIAVHEYTADTTDSKYDLVFHFTQQAAAIKLELEYCTDLFKPESINRMLDHFVRMMDQMLRDTRQSVGGIEYLSPDEKHFLLHQFNDGISAFPRHLTIVDLFEAQVRATPDNIALVFDDKQMSYRELNSRSNRLAWWLLRQYSIGQDALIGIMTERTERMIIALLAVLKAGAGYVPIDPLYPADRKEYIIKDANLLCVLTDDTPFDDLAATAGDDNPATVTSPDAIAYVIYTSGSTGQPKGCMVMHRNVVNLLKNEADRFAFGPADVWVMAHSFSFDFSVWEIYGALLNGGKLVIPEWDDVRDVNRFYQLVRAHKVTVLNQTPGAFYNFIEAQKDAPCRDLSTHLRYVIFGGDKVNLWQLRDWEAIYSLDDIRLINMYGITETTVHVSFYAIKREDIYAGNGASLIGHGIPGVTIYILDRQGLPVPVGVKGEFYVGGEGVCRGYLNKEGLTNEKFLQNKFGKGLLYKTGDWGRIREDGNIEYIGRDDHQVKVRGHRIELAEIEMAMAAFPGVETAVAIIREGESGRYIAGYYTAAAGIGETALRQFLDKKLPAYMVPAYLVSMDRIPLTNNGKLDRKQLPDPLELTTGPSTSFVAPRNATEEQMVHIWQKVLRRDGMGIMDNFFSAGGDSVKAIRLVNEINKAFSITIEVRDIFTYPTILHLFDHCMARQSLPLHEEQGPLAGELDNWKEKIIKQVTGGHQSPESWEDVYPMSDIEKGMLYHSLVDPTSGIYHDQVFFQVTEEAFDVALFSKAVGLLVDKHPILRTSFLFMGNEECQVVHKTAFVPFDIPFEDLSPMDTAQQKVYLSEYLQKDRKDPFDLARPGLWRLRIFRLSHNEYTFLFVCHHAIMDGWSDASFKTELSQVYYTLKTDKHYIPLPLRSSYKDFVIDQLRWKQDAGTRQFWKEYLLDYSRTPLPYEKLLTKVAMVPSESHAFQLDPALTALIDQQTRQQQWTAKTIYLAAFCQLLRMTSMPDDLVIGLSTNGRPATEDGDKILGCFLNTVPFRVRGIFNQHNDEFLRSIDRLLIESKQYDKLSLYEIARLSQQGTDHINPVSDIMFTYLDFHIYREAHAATVASDPLQDGHVKANTLFTFSIVKSNGQSHVLIDYIPSLYRQEEIEKLEAYYIDILRHLLGNPGQVLHFDAIAGRKEKELLLTTFTATERDYPRDKTLTGLFAEQVSRTPDKTAIVCEDRTITYRELDERSTVIAAYLQHTYDLQRDDLVGLLTARSEWMIIGLLAILKAGAGYVPLDPESPAERLGYMLQDAAVKVLLTDTEHMFGEVTANHYRGPLYVLDLAEVQPVGEQVTPGASDSQATAYVIYTSGSTGLPKGCIIEHHSVINMIVDLARAFGITEQDRLLQFASVCFDASAYEIFTSLLYGCTLVLVSREQISDPQRFIDHLNSHQVSLLNVPPSFLAALPLEQLPSLRVIITAGQAADVAIAARASRQAAYYNAYGPTECAVCATFYQAGPADAGKQSIPIGRPLSNTKIYILDEQSRLVPTGIRGEICISGAGVGRGYLRQPELTAQKFIDHPFAPGERLYRTGDMGRWLPDGNIEYLGRKDEQLKVRGYRIEPGEIENVLTHYTGIESAVVVARQAGEAIQLAAYYKTRVMVEAAALRKYLEEKLPSYMVPVWLVEVGEYPLTASGKIDKKRLPDPLAPSEGEELYEAPAGQAEEQLAVIWREVLGRERIGRNEAFFAAGGDSIRAIRIIAQVHRALGVSLTIADIFAHPTIADMASLVSSSRQQVYESIPLVDTAPHYPLSHGQKRLWIIDQVEPGTTAYNIAAAYNMEGDLQPHFLEQAFNDLVDRHEILRTVFIVQQGAPFQQVCSRSRSGYRMDFTDLSNHPDPQALLEEAMSALWSYRFDLATGPLFKTQLLRLDRQRFVFMLCIHHIIADGWSMEVMIKEVMQRYTSLVTGSPGPLQPLRIQYKDYAAWQHTTSQQQAMTAHRNYWLQQLGGELPILALPTDHRRPAIKTYRGAVVSTLLPQQLLPLITDKCTQLGLSTFMVLLAGVKILLHRYTGQQDIVIGIPIAGRDHLELEDQLGFYVNTLALRSQPRGGDSFDSYLLQLKQVTLDGYAHQAYPFDQLVEELQLPRDMGRMPVFDVMVTHQNNALQAPAASLAYHQSLQVQEYSSQSGMSKFDMLFFFRETSQGIGLQVEYSTDLFSPARMERLIEHYCGLLEQLLPDGSRPISAAHYLPAAELAQLQAFNPQPATSLPVATLVELWNIQVRLRPDDTALVYEGVTLTYEQLHTQSNQLANYLRQQGTQKGQLVAILLERSQWMVIAILGILKAGAGYVPLDPAYPTERLRFLLEDAGAACLLTSPGVPLMDHPQQLCLPDQWDKVAVQSSEAPGDAPAGSDIAYVIYTSGSTGTPKGCVVEHRAILNTIHWFGQQYSISHTDRLLARTPVIFDVSVMELMTPLCFGAAVVICSTEDMSNPGALATLIDQHAITTIVFVPSLLTAFEDWVQVQDRDAPGLHSLRQFMATGEALSQQTVNRHYEQWDIPLYNLYGPTEAAVEATHYHTRPGQETVLIGKPVSNTSVHIVDESLQPVPIGVEGEVCLSGSGLARGYLHRNELTQQKFIDNPFEPGTRLYRTGDRGRWLDNGQIEYLGRKDEQVKLRGYRIELAEIEQALESYEPVESAVVVARGEGAGQYLVAYYKSRSVPEVHYIREYLSERLPAYMVPAQLVQVSEFILTPSGKIDRKRLPDPLYSAADETPGHTPPRNELERQLAAIWEKVLGKQHIGIYDNFFELGGDSIKAILVSSALYQAGYQLEIADLFRYPRIETLSKTLGRINAEKMADQSAVSGIVPLTPIQQAFFQAAHPKPHHYNQSVLLHAAQGYQRAVVEAVIAHLQLHHDALRMVFRTTPDNILQEHLGTEHPVQVQEFDLRQAANATDQLETIANDIQAGIDLQNGPLLQAALFKMNDGDRLLIVVHHLVIDGISWRILFEDFATLYRQYNAGEPLTLPAKTDSFKRWAEKLQDFANTPAFLQQKAYWQALEKTTVVPLRKDSDLPVTNQVSDTSTGTFELDEQETDLLLTKVNRAYATEINDILLSALAMAVATTIGQRQVLIALEGHGRENILPSVDINRTIGWFTSLYPVIIDINPAHDLSRQLREVKETLRQVPDKGIGHGMLKYLTTPSLKEDMAFLLEPEISFNYLGQFDADLSNASLQTADETTGQNYSEDTNRSYHIDVIAIVTGGQLQVSVVYNRHLYRSTTINGFLQAFKQSLQQIITHCASGQHHTVTPSDLTFKGLSIQDLETIGNLIN